MKNINIFSTYNFLVEIENKNYYIDKLLSIEIKNINKDNLLLKIYPLEQNNLSIPYCLKLYDNNNKVSCKCDNVKIYNLNNRCDIFLYPFNIYSFVVVYTKNLQIDNIEYTVSCYQDRINIKSKAGENTFETNLTSAQAFKDKQNIFILTKNKNNKSLIVFNTNDKTFNKITAEKIEIKNNVVTTLESYNDMSSHFLVCKYDLDKELNKQKEQTYIKQENKKHSFVDEIIPYNFFESIKAKDYSLARTFLTSELSNILTNDSLNSYFGKFENISIVNLNPLTYTLYSQNYAKDYEITIKNSLISEINEI